jgi:hypothetical protein
MDLEGTEINLAKGLKELPQKGFYPADLTTEKFHHILMIMLQTGKRDEVAKILNQRTVVEYDGEFLKAIDYVDYFKNEFEKIAKNLENAAKISTDKNFNEYLILQAKALRTADPILDAYADKKWAQLQDSPLEFTITRENYDDRFTISALENPELKKLLQENNINLVSKDSLGIRVGIINKIGTDAVLKTKKHLPQLAEKMPFNGEYEQNISDDTKQSMVDADIVALCGSVGAYCAGITVAENLPNDDKMSLTIGGGRRNVYHRQIRFVSDMKKFQERLDAILDPLQHSLYDLEADHLFTIGHENAHSLGPNKGTDALGKYQHIIEENKADLASIIFADHLYSKEIADKILTTFVVDLFSKTKPTLDQAHRVREVMQAKYLYDRGAWQLKDGKIFVHLEKILPAVDQMLHEVVRIQIDRDFNAGEKYVNDNFVWLPEMETIAQSLRKINKRLNGGLESKLAEFLNVR